MPKAADGRSQWNLLTLGIHIQKTFSSSEITLCIWGDKFKEKAPVKYIRHILQRRLLCCTKGSGSSSWIPIRSINQLTGFSFHLYLCHSFMRYHRDDSCRVRFLCRLIMEVSGRFSRMNRQHVKYTWLWCWSFESGYAYITWGLAAFSHPVKTRSLCQDQTYQTISPCFMRNLFNMFS